MTSLRSQLREKTRPAHLEVEDAFARFELDTAEGSWEMVRAHILMLQRFLPEVAAYPSYHAEIARLKALVPPQHERLADLHLFAFPAVERTLHPLAIAYVILGSRLGARMLSRDLSKSTNLIAPEVLAFLGDDRSRGVWQELCQELDGICADQIRTEVIADAERVFEIYRESAVRLQQMREGSIA